MAKRPKAAKPPPINPVVPWSIASTDENAHRLTLDFANYHDTFPTLHISDLHWDSIHCRRDLLARDLDVALKIGAPVLIYGDMFDLMQGKLDKRGSKSGVRPEYQGDSHFDLIFEDAVKWWTPYAPILALASLGNHETGYQKYQERDFLAAFVFAMRRAGSPVAKGGYWGFVSLQGRNERGRHVSQLSLHYHHGYGGGGEVTRGMIDNSRTRGQYEADIYCGGHVHRRQSDQNVIVYMDRLGKIRRREQWFLRAGTYKDELGTQGYHVEKGRAARPMGGWWLDLALERSPDGVILSVSPRPTRGERMSYQPAGD